MKYRKYLTAVVSVSVMLLLIEISCYLMLRYPYSMATSSVHFALDFLGTQFGSRYKINSFKDYFVLRNNASRWLIREMILAKWLHEWGIEKYAYIPFRHLDAMNIDYTPTSVLYSNNLLKPNVDINITLLDHEHEVVVFPKHRITTNMYGRRNTYYENQGKVNLLFYGCSYTFGLGVSDKQTFPSVVGQLTKMNTYNFGYTGDAANSTLIKLKKHENYRSVANLPTIVIFTFIDDHMKRIVGTSDFFQRNKKNYYKPFYYFKDHQLVVNKSGFVKPVLAFRWLARLVGNTNFARLFNISFPRITKGDLLIVASLFVGIEQELRRLYPDFKKMYVSFFPGEKKFASQLKPMLKKYNIPFFDYSEINVNELMKGHNTMKHDSHPSPELYDLYAFLLSKDLQSSGVIR